MDAAQFRTTYPEFSDVARFPTSQINGYIALANRTAQVSFWGDDLLPVAQGLLIAHNLAILSGSGGGPVSSKSVGSVSVSYDTTSTSELGAGWYNRTIYGQQYYRLMRMYGAGAIQL